MLLPFTSYISPLVVSDINIYFIPGILFKVIRHRVSVIVHFGFLPKARIRFITYLKTFVFHCLQHIISHSINHILIWNIILRCILTIWSGMYKTDNTIFTSIIDKWIITGGELMCKTKWSYSPVVDIPHPNLVKYLSRYLGSEQTCIHALVIRWVIIICLREAVTVPMSHKSTHKVKLRTKTWYSFLILHQEEPSDLSNQWGNNKKGYYLSPDTYIDILSVPSRLGYILIWLSPFWDHTLLYYYMHLSGAYVCFPTQGRLFCLPNTYVFRTILHHICRLAS